MIGIPLGLVYANALEWGLHKYVLHGLGRNRDSFWAFHFHDHHRNARQHGFRDPDYERSLWGWHAQSKEALASTSGPTWTPSGASASCPGTGTTTWAATPTATGASPGPGSTTSWAPGSR